MARTVEVVINGTAYHMPVSYRASKEIAEAVGDPLKFAMDAHKGQLNLTVDEVVRVVSIGCKNAGCSLPMDQIGEAVVEGGVLDYLKIAVEYITAFCSSGPSGGAPSKKATRK